MENESTPLSSARAEAAGRSRCPVSDRYRVQSLGRGLDLLEHVGRAGPEGERLTHLAAAIRLSKAATYAMLQTFLAHGYVIAMGDSASTRRYRLGMSLARLGDLAVANITLADVAMPVLRDLTEETRMTSRVAVLDEGYAVVVGRADAPGAIRFDAALGRRELPHCSAVGKALLAAMPRADAKAILRRLGMPRRTASTLTTMSSLDDELDLTIARGYAIDNEEDTAGVVCLGTCVFDRMGKAAGAISVTGLKQNHSWKKQGRLAEALVRHADEISSRLGGPNVAVAWASKRK